MGYLYTLYFILHEYFENELIKNIRQFFYTFEIYSILFFIILLLFHVGILLLVVYFEYL